MAENEKKQSMFLEALAMVLNSQVAKDLASATGKALVAVAETATIKAKAEAEIAVIHASTAKVVAETKQAKAKAELRKVEATAPIEMELALAEMKAKRNAALLAEAKSERELHTFRNPPPNGAGGKQAPGEARQ